MSIAFIGTSVALLLTVAGNVCAQAFNEVQTSSTPLVLKAQGRRNADRKHVGNNAGWSAGRIRQQAKCGKEVIDEIHNRHSSLRPCR